MGARFERVAPWDQNPTLERVYGGGSAPSMPGGLPGPPPPPQTLRPVAAVPPFYYVKPPSGIDFYFSMSSDTGLADIAAGAGSTLVIAPTTALRIPDLYEGVVAFVTIFLDAPTTGTDVIFTLRFNGGPVSGADALRSFPRTANNLSITFPFNIVVPGGTTIDVLATNQNANGPWSIGAEVGGWSYAESLRQRVFGDERY